MPATAQQAPSPEHYTLVSGQNLPLVQLAQMYAADPERVARLNILPLEWHVSPEHTILLPVPIEEALALDVVSLFQIQTLPGQTLDTVARTLGIPAPWLSVVNGLKRDTRLFPGQPVIVPAFVHPRQDRRVGQVTIEYLSPILAQGSTGFLTLVAPLDALPHLVWQGQILRLSPIVHTETLGEATHQRFFAHIPVHPLQEPGVWPLTLSYTGQGGNVIVASLPVQIYNPGHFDSRTIVIPDTLAIRLTLENVTAEMEALQQHWDRYSERSWTAEVWQSPLALSYPVSAGFGQRRVYQWPLDKPYPVNFHSGHDFASPLGTPVRAPAPGLVVLAEELLTKGQAVILDHGRGVMTGYWHLDKIEVAAGDEITVGQVLGLVGNTGISLGPHLHWELRIQGIPVHPLQFLMSPLVPPETQE